MGQPGTFEFVCPPPGQRKRLLTPLSETIVVGLVATVFLGRIPEPLSWLDPVPDAPETFYATKALVERGRYEIDVGGQRHPPRYSFGYSAFLLAPVLWATGEGRWLLLVPIACGIAN